MREWWGDVVSDMQPVRVQMERSLTEQSGVSRQVSGSTTLRQVADALRQVSGISMVRSEGELVGTEIPEQVRERIARKILIEGEIPLESDELRQVINRGLFTQEEVDKLSLPNHVDNTELDQLRNKLGFFRLQPDEKRLWRWLNQEEVQDQVQLALPDEVVNQDEVLSALGLARIRNGVETAVKTFLEQSQSTNVEVLPTPDLSNPQALPYQIVLTITKLEHLTEIRGLDPNLANQLSQYLEFIRDDVLPLLNLNDAELSSLRQQATTVLNTPRERGKHKDKAYQDRAREILVVDDNTERASSLLGNLTTTASQTELPRMIEEDIYAIATQVNLVKLMDRLETEQGIDWVEKRGEIEGILQSRPDELVLDEDKQLPEWVNQLLVAIAPISNAIRNEFPHDTVFLLSQALVHGEAVCAGKAQMIAHLLSLMRLDARVSSVLARVDFDSQGDHATTIINLGDGWWLELDGNYPKVWGTAHQEINHMSGVLVPTETVIETTDRAEVERRMVAGETLIRHNNGFRVYEVVGRSHRLITTPDRLQAFNYFNLANLIQNDPEWFGGKEAAVRQAEEYYRKAIKINPRIDYAYTNLGILIKNNPAWFGGKEAAVRQAEEYYRKAIEINPRHFAAYHNRALLRYQNQDIFRSIDGGEAKMLSRMLAYYQKFVELAPNHDFTDFARERIREIQERLEALEAIREVQLGGFDVSGVVLAGAMGTGTVIAPVIGGVVAVWVAVWGSVRVLEGLFGWMARIRGAPGSVEVSMEDLSRESGLRGFAARMSLAARNLTYYISPIEIIRILYYATSWYRKQFYVGDVVSIVKAINSSSREYRHEYLTEYIPAWWESGYSSYNISYLINALNGASAIDRRAYLDTHIDSWTSDNEDDLFYIPYLITELNLENDVVRSEYLDKHIPFLLNSGLTLSDISTLHSLLHGIPEKERQGYLEKYIPSWLGAGIDVGWIWDLVHSLIIVENNTGYRQLFLDIYIPEWLEREFDLNEISSLMYILRDLSANNLLIIIDEIMPKMLQENFELTDVIVFSQYLSRVGSIEHFWNFIKSFNRDDLENVVKVVTPLNLDQRKQFHGQLLDELNSGDQIRSIAILTNDILRHMFPSLFNDDEIKWLLFDSEAYATYISPDISVERRRLAVDVRRSVLGQISDSKGLSIEEAGLTDDFASVSLIVYTVAEQVAGIGASGLSSRVRHFLQAHGVSGHSVDEITRLVINDIAQISRIEPELSLGYTYGIELEVLENTRKRLESMRDGFVRDDHALTKMFGLNEDKGETSQVYEMSTRPTVGVTYQKLIFDWLQEANFIEKRLLSRDIENYSMHISTTIEEQYWNNRSFDVFTQMTRVLGVLFSSTDRLRNRGYLAGGAEIADKSMASSFDKEKGQENDEDYAVAVEGRFLIERRIFDVTPRGQHLLFSTIEYWDHAFRVWARKYVVGEQLFGEEDVLADMFESFYLETTNDFLSLKLNYDTEIPYVVRSRRPDLVERYRQRYMDIVRLSRNLVGVEFGSEASLADGDESFVDEFANEGTRDEEVVRMESRFDVGEVRVEERASWFRVGWDLVRIWLGGGVEVLRLPWKLEGRNRLAGWVLKRMKIGDLGEMIEVENVGGVVNQFASAYGVDEEAIEGFYRIGKQNNDARDYMAVVREGKAYKLMVPVRSRSDDDWNGGSGVRDWMEGLGLREPRVEPARIPVD